MSWHRADSKQRMSLQHSKRKSEVLHCMGRRATGVGVDRVCRGSKATSRGRRTRVARLEHSSRGYAGAAIPRLQKLMDNAAKATAPTPNATIFDDEDRAPSAQLCWMTLMICNGAALNTVFRSLATADRSTSRRRELDSQGN